MMLRTTFNAEQQRLDGQINALARKLYSSLARCDYQEASRVRGEIRALRRRKIELVQGSLPLGHE